MTPDVLASRIRYAAAALLAVFAVVSFDTTYFRWGLLQSAIYLGIVAVQFMPFALVRAWALFLGLFLAGTCIFSALSPPLFTLPPNMRMVTVIRPGLMTGGEGEHRITTDARGFRVTKPVDYTRPANLRIFAIGGSTTEQIFMDDHKTWAHRLQERLPDAEVINTGLSGLRAEHHLATFDAIRSNHPDLVLFLVGVNDWFHEVRTHFDPAGHASVNWRDRLSLRRSPFGAILRGKGKPRETRREINKDPYPRGSLQREKVVQYCPESVSPLYRATMSQIFEACRASGTRCMFLTQPHGYRGTDPKYLASFWATPSRVDYTLDLESLNCLADRYNRYLLDEARANGMDTCDTASATTPSFAHFHDGVHFNDEGSRRIAETVEACIRDLDPPVAATRSGSG